MDYLFTTGVSCRRFPEAIAQYRLEGVVPTEVETKKAKEVVAKEIEQV